jgi:ATP-dependent Clp protease adaptor protein ClpS
MSAQEGVLERTQFKAPSRYAVRLLNDNFTPVEFVTALIQSIFGLDEDKAFELTMKVHTEGYARIGEYTREVAEWYCAKIRNDATKNGFPLEAVPDKLAQ